MIALIALVLGAATPALGNESLVAILKREVERDLRVSCAHVLSENGSASQQYVYRCSDVHGVAKAEIRAVYESIPGDILGRRALRTLETSFFD